MTRQEIRSRPLTMHDFLEQIESIVAQRRQDLSKAIETAMKSPNSPTGPIARWITDLQVYANLSPDDRDKVSSLETELTLGLGKENLTRLLKIFRKDEAEMVA